MNKDLLTLHSALKVVEQDAISQIQYHTEETTKKPLWGWSAAKHYEYHAARRSEAVAVRDWVFIRLMQIDPD